MHQLIKIAVIPVMLGAFFLTAGSAQAGPVLTATHTIVSQQSTSVGTRVTLHITISNSGMGSLSNVTLNLMDPPSPAGPGSNALAMGNLAAGGTASATWSLSVLGPEMPAMPLMLDASGTDANGNVIHVPVLSEAQ